MIPQQNLSKQIGQQKYFDLKIIPHPNLESQNYFEPQKDVD